MDCAHTDGLLYGQYEARNQPVEGRHNIPIIDLEKLYQIDFFKIKIACSSN